MSTKKVWLYTRGKESIRVIVDGLRVTVCGPGDDETTQYCEDEDDAGLQQKQIEQRLLLRGWGLDRLITERRSGHERRDGSRDTVERRRKPD